MSRSFGTVAGAGRPQESWKVTEKKASPMDLRRNRGEMAVWMRYRFGMLEGPVSLRPEGLPLFR